MVQPHVREAHGPTLLDDLFQDGLLIPTGVDGLYGRSGAFERIVEGIEALVTRAGADQDAEVLRFPPAMSRTHFERSGYMRSFPQLAGTVHCFCGDERGHREIVRCLEAGDDWTGQQVASDLVLVPAACYPVYPTLARRGPLPSDIAVVDVQSYCFRHEPSVEPTRMQLFRMREYVCVGTPERVQAFREDWLVRGPDLVETLGLPHHLDAANDPFFGRAGKMVASSQRDQGLKVELLIPVNDGASPTACLSFNYHLDHFGSIWGLRTPDGEVAHTACVGFGLERLTLALLRHHGSDLGGWPPAVRTALSLT